MPNLPDSDTDPDTLDITTDTLERALASVVSLHTRVPDDALTADALGTERAGHGVLIDASGLIVTIGYLVTEADTVWIVSGDAQATPGHVVGYDQETGFGLVQSLQPLALQPITLGSSAALAIGDSVVIAGAGGGDNAVRARLIARQEFAGYWEYLLDDALFTSPAHPNWGGTALIGNDGTLRGIGSLLVQQGEDDDEGSNMIVPIDLLKPILEDLQRLGRSARPPRPWLGLMATEIKGALVVANLVDGGPAALAAVHTGDIILDVAGEPVDELATLFRRVWALGEAGVDVPLTLLRNGSTLDVMLRSVDRYALLRAPQLH